MFVRQLYDEVLAHASYVIGCQRTGEALVVDPSRDIDRYIALAHANNLRIVAAVDTHIHADYLSGLQAFATQGIHVYASREGGDAWQYEWLRNAAMPHTLLSDGDEFRIGNIRFQAMHTPGHTPEHLSYLVYDRDIDEPVAVLSGDFMFVGDLGRPDLLETAAGVVGAREPSARELFHSVQKIRALQPYLQVWPAHGAGSACGKGLGAMPMTTLGYELRHNAAILAASSDQEFVPYILKGQPATPLYFARMKRDNRAGIPAWKYGAPARLPSQAPDSVLIDVRPLAQRARDVANAISAPLDAQFPAIVGSYVAEGARITLVSSSDVLELATRVLARIGYDAVVGYVLAEDLPPAGALPSISFAKLPKQAHVLDVRTEDEFRERHVRGAQNIPHTKVIQLIRTLPKETVYVHCATGSRARAATTALRAHGVDAVLIADAFSAFTGATEEEQ